MHAVENVDIYSSLSRNVSTGGKHGKSQGHNATSVRIVLRGVRGQKGNWT